MRLIGVFQLARFISQHHGRCFLGQDDLRLRFVLKLKVELGPFLQYFFDSSARYRVGERGTGFDFQNRAVIKFDMERTPTLRDALDGSARDDWSKFSIQHGITFLSGHSLPPGSRPPPLPPPS